VEISAVKLKFIERVTEFIYLFLLEIYFPIGVKLKTRELSDVLLSIYEFVKISLERIMLFFVGKEI
jgi:hypothetical protein